MLRRPKTTALPKMGGIKPWIMLAGASSRSYTSKANLPSLIPFSLLPPRRCQPLVVPVPDFHCVFCFFVAGFAGADAPRAVLRRLLVAPVTKV